MDSKTERLVNALTRVCVFVHTSRHWDDYENMRLDSDALVEMTQWISGRQEHSGDSIDEFVSDVSSSQYSALKTDWAIGCAQIASVVSMLDGREKAVVGSYLESSMSMMLDKNLGVKKAVDTVLKAM